MDSLTLGPALGARCVRRVLAGLGQTHLLEETTAGLARDDVIQFTTPRQEPDARDAIVKTDPFS
jgi:hypothetical protein